MSKSVDKGERITLAQVLFIGAIGASIGLI